MGTVNDEAAGDQAAEERKPKAATKAQQAAAQKQFAEDMLWMASDRRGRRLLGDMIRPLLRAGFSEGRRVYAQQVYNTVESVAPDQLRVILGEMVGT